MKGFRSRGSLNLRSACFMFAMTLGAVWPKGSEVSSVDLWCWRAQILPGISKFPSGEGISVIEGKEVGWFAGQKAIWEDAPGAWIMVREVGIERDSEFPHRKGCVVRSRSSGGQTNRHDQTSSPPWMLGKREDLRTLWWKPVSGQSTAVVCRGVQGKDSVVYAISRN